MIIAFDVSPLPFPVSWADATSGPADSQRSWPRPRFVNWTDLTSLPFRSGFSAALPPHGRRAFHDLLVRVGDPSGSVKAVQLSQREEVTHQIVNIKGS